jgi:acetyltransferase-like isoleucine patch superfamily enzyme
MRSRMLVRRARPALVRKLTLLVAKYFPWNVIRCSALRAAGYTVGQDVYIGEEIHVTDDLLDYHAKTHLIIGDRVAVSQRVLIILSSHANRSRLRKSFRTSSGTVRIEDDAWIGAGVIILPNVTIGKMSVIGAGSVVTRDVPALSVAVGNPARIIRSLRGVEGAAV